MEKNSAFPLMAAGELALLSLILSQSLGGAAAGLTAHQMTKRRDVDKEIAEAQLVEQLWQSALQRAANRSKIKAKEEGLVSTSRAYDWMGAK